MITVAVLAIAGAPAYAQDDDGGDAYIPFTPDPGGNKDPKPSPEKPAEKPNNQSPATPAAPVTTTPAYVAPTSIVDQEAARRAARKAERRREARRDERRKRQAARRAERRQERRDEAAVAATNIPPPSGPDADAVAHNAFSGGPGTISALLAALLFVTGAGLTMRGRARDETARGTPAAA